jgi:glycerol-3-phosphate acyltransferase PlsY
VGHIYPVWLNFKGGKGVSVAFGGLMYVLGVPFAVVSIAIWIVALKIIKIMSLVNLVLFALLPVYVYATTQSLAYKNASAFVALIIWWAHRENIARLRTGNEKKLAI